jgi:hypothetical protein
MPLTQFAVTNAAAKDKPYKLTDGDGLHLLIRPNGSKLWRMRYRFNGQENMLAFGMFPATTIAKARAKRDEARALLASGMNPSVKRKLDKIASVTAARSSFARFFFRRVGAFTCVRNSKKTLRPISSSSFVVSAAQALQLPSRITALPPRE